MALVARVRIISIGFKGEKVWIDENANPVSDAVHVVERWTRPDYHRIHVEMLIEGPKYYTRPFTYSRTWALGEPDEQIQEYSCSENNVDAAPGVRPRADSRRRHARVRESRATPAAGAHEVGAGL